MLKPKTYQPVSFFRKVFVTYTSPIKQMDLKTDTKKSETAQNCVAYSGCFQQSETKF